MNSFTHGLTAVHQSGCASDENDYMRNAYAKFIMINAIIQIIIC